MSANAAVAWGRKTSALRLGFQQREGPTGEVRFFRLRALPPVRNALDPTVSVSVQILDCATC